MVHSSCATAFKPMLYIVILILCVSFGATQPPVFNYNEYEAPERIISNPPSPILLVAPYFLPSNPTCTQGLLTYTKDGNDTGCLTNHYGTEEVSFCDDNFIGITELACMDFCLALNPITRNMIMFDPYGNIFTIYGNETLVDYPQGMSFKATPTQNTGTLGQMSAVVYDNGLLHDTTFYTEPISGQYYTYNSILNTLQRNDSSPLAGVAGILEYYSDVFIAYKGEDFYVHTASGSAPWMFNTVYGFGSIDVLSSYNDRVYIFDSSNKTIFVINADDQVIGIATTTNEISKFAFSNDYMYAIDDFGVLRWSNAPRLRIFEVTESTCASSGGTLSFEFANGAEPMNFRVLPDPNHILTTAPSSTQTMINNRTVINIPKISPYAYNYTVFDDAWAFGVRVAGDSFTPFEIVNASEIAPHTGNTSLKFTLLRTQTIPFTPSFTVTCVAEDKCIDSHRYSAIEFYLNVGEGGQTFTIDIEYLPKLTINGSKLEPNKWHKITIDLSRAKYVTYAFYRFWAISETNSEALLPRNPFYIDDIKFIAYDPQYILYTYDACGVINTIPFNITDKTFTTRVTSPTVTCNAAGVNGNKSSDAIADAIITNGVGPFAFSWNFTGVSSNSSLKNLSSRSSVITVYDDGLNSTWTDASRATSIVMLDTTRAHSGRTSFSFAPSVFLDAFSFISPEILDSENYPTIEFWVNGGDKGGQRISLLIERQSLSVAQANIEPLLQFNSIPPNAWHKVSYTFDTTVNLKYNKITLEAAGEFIQSRVYFDDLVILSKPVLTVHDYNGCAAIVDRMVVNTPPPLTWTQRSHNVKCFNGSDGSITIDVLGGVAPYSYKYSSTLASPLTGVSTTTHGLSESGITAEVTDSNGCVLPPVQFVVLSPPALELTQTVKPVQCNKKSAVITTHTTGGTGPYTFYWLSSSPFFVIPQSSPVSLFSDSPISTVSLSSNAEVLCAGTGGAQTPRLSYSPSHSGYCSIAPRLTVSAPSMSISCETCMLPKDKYTGINLWIYIQKVSDVAKLSFALNHQNATVQSAVSLASFANITSPGWNEVFFNFTSNSLRDELVISSSDPANMGVILLDDIVLMSKDKDGVGISVHPGFNSVIEGTAGDYYLTVIDSNGCAVVQKLNITEPAAITTSEEIEYPSKHKASDGKISVTVQGGTPPYSYLWNASRATTSELTDITFGTYLLTITDANGCVLETSVVVDPSKASYIREYQKNLAAGLGAIVGVGIVIALFAVIVLVVYWSQFSILGSFFCACLLLGVIISYIAAITLLPRPTDALCTAFPWLLGIAFVFVYGCLFIKTWALYQVWRNAKQYKKMSLTPAYIIRLIGILMLFEIGFLIMWTVIDRPTARRVKTVDNSYEIQCATDKPTFWIIFLTVKGVWLVFGGVLSVLTRGIVKKYNESASISYAIYNIIILLAIGVPLATLLAEVPGGRVVIEVVITVLAFTFTMVIMFFRSWYNIIAAPDVTIPTVGNSKASTTTRVSVDSSNSASRSPRDSGPPTRASAAFTASSDSN